MTETQAGNLKHGTFILDGVWTSKEAEALNEKVANGLESAAALTIVELLLSIDWDIFLIFNNGITPTARSGRSSENAVYLQHIATKKPKKTNP